MKKVITWLRTRGLTSSLVFLLIVLAGPLVVDVAILIDLITVVGADVFLLSVFLYYRSVFVEFHRACISMFRPSLIRSGLLMPNQEWLQSPAELCRYLGHNLCVFSTIRPVFAVFSLALIFVPLVAVLLVPLSR